ncbi:uncharacterized protein LOC144945731 [Lampetra fluviatilis]
MEAAASSGRGIRDAKNAGLANRAPHVPRGRRPSLGAPRKRDRTAACDLTPWPVDARHEEEAAAAAEVPFANAAAACDLTPWPGDTRHEEEAAAAAGDAPAETRGEESSAGRLGTTQAAASTRPRQAEPSAKPRPLPGPDPPTCCEPGAISSLRFSRNFTFSFFELPYEPGLRREARRNREVRVLMNRVLH